MDRNSSVTPDRVRRQARRHAQAVRQFMNFAGVYLAVGTFFLLINVFSGIGSLWFFWPMLPMTIPLVILGWRAFAVERFDDDWVEQQVEKRARASAAASPVEPGTELDALTAHAGELIDDMRRSARQIRTPGVRAQALDVCAKADHVLSAIGDNPEEVALARDFVGRYLTPARTIFDDYARLSTRNIAAAQPTLARVEDHDLPLLAKKLDEVHERLHRGSLIDLQVAREMLSLDISDWEMDALDAKADRNSGEA